MSVQYFDFDPKHQKNKPVSKTLIGDKPTHQKVAKIAPTPHKISKKTMPSLTDNHKQGQIEHKKKFEWAFLHPKYWGIWLLIGILLPIMLLPLGVQFWIGRQIGLLVFYLAKRRQKDTLVNLQLAYPTKTDSERYLLAKQVFENQGIGIFESLCAWYRPNVFVRTFSVSGLQHIIHAQKQQKAVILLGMHTTMLDLGGRIATQLFCADCVYRPQNNALLEWLIYNARRRIFETQIESRNMKKLATRIKSGKIVWYTPDQDFGLSHGVIAPFFGIPCATITVQRRLARLDKKNPPNVIMMQFVRETDGKLFKRPHYHINFTPIDNYPSDNEHADATRINAMIEQRIKQSPAQWMWFHRRFKTQPNAINYYKK